MNELESFGQRLAWARNQRGLTLKQVSERTRSGRTVNGHLAIGYISQLEKGAKLNPTRVVEEDLAGALEVTVAFLRGEALMDPVTGIESVLSGGRAARIGSGFRRHFEALPQIQKDNFLLVSVETRFIFVVEWLLTGYDGEVLRELVIANAMMGISVRALRDVTFRNCCLGPRELDRFCNETGVPMDWFTKGTFPNAEVRLAPEEFLAFQPALVAAKAKGLTPAQVLALIERQ